MKNTEKITASEMRTLWGSRVVIWITMILVLFPVVWIVMSSFSAGDSFFLSSLFPDKFSVEHYVTLFQETDFTIWVFNSLKFCFIVAVIQLILTSLAAYAFARNSFLRDNGSCYPLPVRQQQNRSCYCWMRSRQIWMLIRRGQSCRL